jgi:RNA polymerase sigma-70 factor (ECF subfamily)
MRKISRRTRRSSAGVAVIGGVHTEDERLAAPAESDRLLDEEHRLALDAQKGDRGAFAALAGAYYDRLHRWLYHLTRDRHTAEDLTQETLLKAFAAMARFKAGTNFRAWLFRIAYNSFVNQRRSVSRQRESLPENLPDDEDGPVEQAIQREAQAQLAEAVQRLPADYRAAFLLRVEEGLSFRQIADIFGLTEETARWRVFKARQKLLRTLAPPLEQEKP